MRSFAIVFLLWICSLATTACAETRVALVIGNGAYRSVPQLDNTGNDAASVAKALGELGFEVQLEENLSRDDLFGVLRRFELVADNSDWAVVYFAGHGIEVGGMNYLVPIDARFANDRDIAEEAVSLDRVLARLEGARKLRLVILDACRNNPFVNMKRSLATRSIGRGLGAVEPDVGTLVAFAAKAGSTALDGTGQTSNSPYAAALIKNLAEADIELDFFFRLVREDVLKATGKQQDPAVYGSLPAQRFVFRQSPDEPTSLKAAPAASPSLREHIAICDRLAGADIDPDRPRGVEPSYYASLTDKQAFSSCSAASKLSLAALFASAAPEDIAIGDATPLKIETRRMLLQLGRVYYTTGRFSEARKSFEQSSALGGIASKYYLGEIYLRGEGIERDYVLARHFYEKAAEAGIADGQNSLGYIYKNGLGVTKDLVTARSWYLKAAKAGDGESMLTFADMNANGDGGPRDYAAAGFWLERAAEQGNAEAMNRAALFYRSGKGGPDGHRIARKWLTINARGGDLTAMTLLGEMHYLGQGGNKDYAKAIEWYSQAADKKYGPAMRNLGNMYNNGIGVKKDTKIGQDWINKSHTVGDVFDIMDYNELTKPH